MEATSDLDPIAIKINILVNINELKSISHRPCFNGSSIWTIVIMLKLSVSIKSCAKTYENGFLSLLWKFDGNMVWKTGTLIGKKVGTLFDYFKWKIIVVCCILVYRLITLTAKFSFISSKQTDIF